MRILLISVMLLFGLGKCLAQADSSPISVTIKVDSEYVKTYSKKSDYFKYLIREKDLVVKSDSIKETMYNIALTIKNCSDTTIEISLMTCSYTDNFLVNNKYMYIKGQNCDHNVAEGVEFKPGESKVYAVTLGKSIELDYTCKGCAPFPPVETTKLGLIIIGDVFRRKPFVNYYLGMEDKSEWNIVWSNPLYLLTEKQAHPKPLQFGVYQKERN